MAGKSSIMEALVWCLFGKLLRGLERADDVVNRKARRDCSVFVSFLGSGSTFSVQRYRKHQKFQNRLRLFRGEQPLSFRHEADTQKKLEEILGCDFSAFVNSTVFGGFDGSRKQFAKLTDAEQKKVLDSFLKFEKFELALKRTKRILADSRELCTKTQLEIEKQRGVVLSLKERVSTLKASVRIFRERASEDRRKLRKRLAQLKLPKITVTEEMAEKANEEWQDLVSQVSSLEVKLHAGRKKLAEIDYQIRDRKGLEGKRCPFCKAVITTRTIKQFRLHVKVDRSKIVDRLRILTVKLHRKNRRLKHGRERLKRLTEKRRTELSDLTIIKGKREELETRLERMVAPTPFSTEIESSSIDYSRATSRLLVSEYKNQSLIARIKDLEFWERGFGNKGVKTLIVREALPSMNNKLSEYAHEILDPGVEIEFKPSKQNSKGEARELFYLHYRSPRNANTYLGESSGGRRRIDICVLLVFSWMARICNLLLVDELLDGLDDTGRETVLDILSRRGGTVLIITHERELKSKLEKVWTVRKKKGISKIEVNDG